MGFIDTLFKKPYRVVDPEGVVTAFGLAGDLGEGRDHSCASCYLRVMLRWGSTRGGSSMTRAVSPARASVYGKSNM